MNLEIRSLIKGACKIVFRKIRIKFEAQKRDQLKYFRKIMGFYERPFMM
jgi:hypothetical protein